MGKKKIVFLLLLFILLTQIGYSQNICNGYYNSIENDTYIYIHNDTIILPYYSGMIGISMLKGVIDNKKKWVNFIPVGDRYPSVFYHDKHKRMKFKYFEENQSIEILFNMPFNKHWNKFVKTEKPHENKRFQQSIEKHINDMHCK